MLVLCTHCVFILISLHQLWPDINSRVFFGAHHGVSLSRASLSISQDADVISIHTGSYHRQSSCKHLLLHREHKMKTKKKKKQKEEKKNEDEALWLESLRKKWNWDVLLIITKPSRGFDFRLCSTFTNDLYFVKRHYIMCILRRIKSQNAVKQTY